MPLSGLAGYLAFLNALPRTFATWPVWRDSARGHVRFAPLTKKEAARRWYRARRFDRQTHEPGKHGGVIGRTGLAVLYTLLFDFLDYATGRLDPSYAAIAGKAGVCRRAAFTACRRLKELGLLHWQRRCTEDKDEAGRFQLKQLTNAYGINPPSQWKGHSEPLAPPPPAPWQLGAVPPLPDVTDQAIAEVAAGGSREAALARLKDDPRDAVANALAGLFGFVFAADPG
jgi:hypothetical protein